MRSIERILTLAVIVAVLGLAAAQTTLTVWMHDHPPRVPVDEELIAEFMAENPDIQVNYEVIPVADFDLRLYTAVAAGRGPDLFNQATFALGQFRAAGALAPLDVEAAGFGSREDFLAAYSTGAEGAVFDGTPYGIPTELSIYACYSNDELWEAAGLSPAEDFPTTWEEMIDVAETLTVRDDDGNPVQRGFDFNWTSPIFVWLQFNPMVTQLGGQLIDEDEFEATIDTPEVARVMRYWSDWVNEHRLGGPQYTGSRDAFLAGELATDCSFGNWGVPQMEDAGVDYSIHPVPRWSDAVNDNGFDKYGYYYLVNAYADEDVQEAAWKLAGFLAQHPDRYFEEAGLFQPRVEFVESEAFQQNEIMPVFFEEMEKSFFSPRIPGFNEVADGIARARDRVLGGAPVEETLERADSDVQGTLDRARREAERQ
ncbi:MAG: extracellular solute-binding protein [Trueperaceae bacterium]